LTERKARRSEEQREAKSAPFENRKGCGTPRLSEQLRDCHPPVAIQRTV